jgi:hypothetical protein
MNSSLLLEFLRQHPLAVFPSMRRVVPMLGGADLA